MSSRTVVRLHRRHPTRRRAARLVLTALTIACVVLIALVPAAAPLDAHPMPQSHVLLDFDERGVAAELRLPIDRLEVGWGRALTPDPARRVAELRPALVAYLAAHVGAVSPDGRPWRVAVGELTTVDANTPAPELVAHMWLTPPVGAPVRQFALQYDVIVHQLVTHEVLVAVRRDWDGGVVSSTQPEVLGTLRDVTTTLAVDRADGSVWRGFTSVVRLGMHHIREGTDHLLFLLVLLLPAPLLAGRERWDGYAGGQRSAAQLVRIVTAFTVGHSLTLAAGAVGWLQAPSQPVEVLIALSILVSALHALRPLFAGREPLIAAGFGLVHGLAFATLVAELATDPWHATLSILGFNVGIELMQLAVIAVTVPWFLLLARTRAYTPVRVIGAVAAGIAALGWIGERALGWANPIGPGVEAAAAHGPWIVAGLAALALVAGAWERRQGGPLDRTPSSAPVAAPTTRP